MAGMSSTRSWVAVIFCAHPTSLTQFSFSRENSREMSDISKVSVERHGGFLSRQPASCSVSCTASRRLCDVLPSVDRQRLLWAADYVCKQLLKIAQQAVDSRRLEQVCLVYTRPYQAWRPGVQLQNNIKGGCHNIGTCRMLVYLQKAQRPGSALHRALPGILQDKQHLTQRCTLASTPALPQRPGRVLRTGGPGAHRPPMWCHGPAGAPPVTSGRRRGLCAESRY